MKRTPVTKRRRKAAGKGSAFEREISKQLSLWVSHGKSVDLFWRTAMSGGRATVARRKGVVVRQSGDICAVSEEGRSFTDTWYVECKFYRRIDFGQFAITKKGKLVEWWSRAKKEARHYRKRPMLIVKQNGWPILVITKRGHLKAWAVQEIKLYSRDCDVSIFAEMVASRYFALRGDPHDQI